MDRYLLILISHKDLENLKEPCCKFDFTLDDVDRDRVTHNYCKHHNSAESHFYDELCTQADKYVAFFDLDGLLNTETSCYNEDHCKWKALKSISAYSCNDGELLSQLLWNIKRQKVETNNGYTEDVTAIDHLHQLADSLPEPGSYLLEVIWLCEKKEIPHPEDCVQLFGFLKRLDLWHQAKFHQLTINGSTDVSEECSDLSSLQAWKDAVNLIEMHDGDKNIIIRPNIIWTGNICLRNEGGSSSLLSNFQLRFNYDLQVCSQKRDIMKQDTYKLLLNNEIEILQVVNVSDIALHVLCPVQLHLNLIDGSHSDATFFMKVVQESLKKDLCFLGCILYDETESNVDIENDLSTKSWYDFITNKDTTSFARKDLKEQLRKRCMMLIKGSCDQNTLEVFLLKDSSSLSGSAAYEFISDEQSINAENENLNLHGKWNLNFLSAEDVIHAQLSHLNNISEHLKGMDLDGGNLDNLIAKNFVNVPYFKDVTSAKKQMELECSQDFQEFYRINHFSAATISPSYWPERVAWCHQESSSLAGRSLKRLQSGENYMKLAGLPVAAKESNEGIVANLSQLLGRFQDSGEPSSSQLKPIPVIADRLFKQLPSEETVKKLNFKEAVHFIGHGIEYCLDSQNALKLDAKLTRLQNRFISSDTSCTWNHIRTLKASKITSKDKNTDAKEQSCRQKSPSTEVHAEHCKRPKKKGSGEKNNFNASNKSISTKEKQRECLDGNKDTDSNRSDSSKKQLKETRSQRHQRRLKVIVEATIQKYGGVNKEDKMFQSCVNRLFSLCKSFLKDLKTSEGLVAEMKNIAKSNVKQVVDFELRSKSK